MAEESVRLTEVHYLFFSVSLHQGTPTQEFSCERAAGATEIRLLAALT